MVNLKIIKEWSPALKGLLIKDSWQKIANCDVLLVRHDNNCGYNYQGKAYSHILDTVGERCAEKKLKVSAVATPYSKLTLDRAFNSPVSFNRALIFSEIKKRLKIYSKVDYSAQEKHDQFRVYLWTQILEKAKPKIVIGIQPDQYLCTAGKLKNTPIFDFQHGVISEGHIWYGEKYCSKKATETLPDGFLCWDEQAVETLSKWTQDKGIAVQEVGNPWFARFMHPHKNDKLVQESVAKINELFDDRPSILVSLQWGLKKLHPDKNTDGILVPELRDIIKDTIDDYNWILRLHPVQIRGDENNSTRKYLERNFGYSNAKKWVVASELPLPLILTKTDLHITYYSTVVIESSWMGIKSGLLCEEFSTNGQFKNYYQNERKKGLADVLSHNTTEIKKWIAVNLKQGKKDSMFIDTTDKLNHFIELVVERGSAK